MLYAEKVFHFGDLVHCTSLSKDNVENLVLGNRYRVIAIDYLDGTRVYTLSDGVNPHVHTTSEFIGYITEPVNTPVGVKEDVVNHPSHYKAGGIETIDYLKAKMSPEEFRGFLRGNVLKYISRAGKKDDIVQDLEKAEFYLKRLISELKEEKTVEEVAPEQLGDNPMTQRQKQFIAGLCARLGIDRTNLPPRLSVIPDYHDLTEAQATKLIDRLMSM